MSKKESIADRRDPSTAAINNMDLNVARLLMRESGIPGFRLTPPPTEECIGYLYVLHHQSVLMVYVAHIILILCIVNA